MRACGDRWNGGSGDIAFAEVGIFAGEWVLILRDLVQQIWSMPAWNFASNRQGYRVLLCVPPLRRLKPTVIHPILRPEHVGGEIHIPVCCMNL